MKKAFLAAALIHLLFMAMGWLGLRWHRSPWGWPGPSRPSAQSSSTEIVVEFASGENERAASAQPARPARSSRGSATPAHARARSRAPALPNLRRLGIPMDQMLGERYARNGGSGAADENEAEAAKEGGEHRGRMHWLDLAQEGREYPLLQALYRLIDAQLVYPMELKTRGMEGDVQAELHFGPAGEYLESMSPISASAPPYLKVAVARALRAALQPGLPPSLRKFLPPSREGLRIWARFRFVIREGDDASIRAQENFALGRELSFFRVYHHSKLEWQAGPLQGFGPFASLNLLWIPMKIKEAASDKAEIDPLESYRSDPAW